MRCKIQEIESQALVRLCEISRENIYRENIYKDKLAKIICADLFAIEKSIFY